MNKHTIQQALLITTLAISPMAFAKDNSVNINANEQTKQSRSISYLKHDSLDLSLKTELLKKAQMESISPALQKAFRSTESTSSLHNASYDYSLYNASTDLVSDMDDDGFYHRFSVTIDVDTLLDYSRVYADFYLSYEGGPWIYYASSDHFDIHQDNYSDAFSVETELADGYPTGYYDMRIKVYDSESDEYLLTYDYNDDDSLYAIPLEDSYRDEYIDYGYTYVESDLYYPHGGGSMGYLSILLLPLLMLRKINKNRV